MPSGGCLCGHVRIEYSGDPKMKVLCHCSDCRKITGGNYSNNLAIPAQNFKITGGTPKEFLKTADSGKPIISAFCGDCGTTLYRYGDSFGGKDGLMIVKAGVLDDVNLINSTVPDTEIFAAHRINWVSALPGAKQIETMPPQ